MDLASIASGFRKRFKTIDGRSFLGEITVPTATPRQGNIGNPPRILRVGIAAAVYIGDVMVTEAGRHYLLGRHPENDNIHYQAQEFRLFDVDHIYGWKRKATVTDPVTGLSKESGYTDLGLAYCMLDTPMVGVDSVTHVRKTLWRFLTNVPIQLGDILNDQYKVVAITPQLGLWFAEVE